MQVAEKSEIRFLSTAVFQLTRSRNENAKIREVRYMVFDT